MNNAAATEMTPEAIALLPAAEQAQHIEMLPADQQEAAWLRRVEKMQAESAQFWAQNAKPAVKSRARRKSQAEIIAENEEDGIRYADGPRSEYLGRKS